MRRINSAPDLCRDKIAQRRGNVKPSGIKVGMLFATRYRVEKLLGAGGMGLVFKANDEQMRIRVAVKVLLKATIKTDEALLMAARRLKDEARATAMLASPHLVKIFDAGEDPSFGPFIVYEYLPGDSLCDRLGEGELGAARAMKMVIRPLLLGLHALHEKGIVHRDVKPGNLFLGHDSTYLLGDLGLALFEEKEARTKTGAVVGTMHYVPPERLVDNELPADSSDDCYAAAHTIIEALTGQHLRNLLPKHYPLLGSKAKPLTAELLTKSGVLAGMAEPLVKAIQWDREKRYKSAKELLEDLEEGLRGPSRGGNNRQVLSIKNVESRKGEGSAGLLKRFFTMFFLVALLGLALWGIHTLTGTTYPRDHRESGDYRAHITAIESAMRTLIKEPSTESVDALSMLADVCEQSFPALAESHEGRRKLAQALKDFPKGNANSDDICTMVKFLWESKHGSPRRAAKLFDTALVSWSKRAQAAGQSSAYSLGGMSRLICERVLLEDLEIKELERLALADHIFRFDTLLVRGESNWYLGHRVIDDMLCQLAMTKRLVKDFEKAEGGDKKPYSEAFERIRAPLLFALKSPHVPQSQRKCALLIYECFKRETKTILLDFEWPEAPAALSKSQFKELLTKEFKQAERQWNGCWEPHIRARYKDGRAFIAREHIRLRVLNPTIQLMRGGFLTEAAEIEQKLFFLIQMFNLFMSNEIYLAKARENRFFVAPVDILEDQLLLNYYEALFALEKATFKKGLWVKSAEILAHYEHRYGTLAKSGRMKSYHGDFIAYFASRRSLVKECLLFNEKLRDKELALQAKTKVDEKSFQKAYGALLEGCLTVVAQKENIPLCYPTVAHCLDKLHRSGYSKTALLKAMLRVRGTIPSLSSLQEETTLLKACAEIIIMTASLANELKHKDIMADLRQELLYLRKFSRQINIKVKEFNRYILLEEESKE